MELQQAEQNSCKFLEKHCEVVTDLGAALGQVGSAHEARLGSLTLGQRSSMEKTQGIVLFGCFNLIWKRRNPFLTLGASPWEMLVLICRRTSKESFSM